MGWYGYGDYGYGFRPYVSVAQRRAKAQKELAKLAKKGYVAAPIVIEMDCSCPDWAGMCKHIAAVMYGIGARLDVQPELLFKLRQLDHLELIAEAGTAAVAASAASTRKGRRMTIASDALGDVFGIEM